MDLSVALGLTPRVASQASISACGVVDLPPHLPSTLLVIAHEQLWLEALASTRPPPRPQDADARVLAICRAFSNARSHKYSMLRFPRGGCVPRPIPMTLAHGTSYLAQLLELSSRQDAPVSCSATASAARRDIFSGGSLADGVADFVATGSMLRVAADAVMRGDRHAVLVLTTFPGHHVGARAQFLPASPVRDHLVNSAFATAMYLALRGAYLGVEGLTSRMWTREQWREKLGQNTAEADLAKLCDDAAGLAPATTRTRPMRVAIVDFDVHNGSGTQELMQSLAAALRMREHVFACVDEYRTRASTALPGTVLTAVSDADEDILNTSPRGPAAIESAMLNRFDQDRVNFNCAERLAHGGVAGPRASTSVASGARGAGAAGRRWQARRALWYRTGPTPDAAATDCAAVQHLRQPPAPEPTARGYIAPARASATAVARAALVAELDAALPRIHATRWTPVTIRDGVPGTGAAAVVVTRAGPDSSARSGVDPAPISVAAADGASASTAPLPHGTAGPAVAPPPRLHLMSVSMHQFVPADTSPCGGLGCHVLRHDGVYYGDVQLRLYTDADSDAAGVPFTCQLSSQPVNPPPPVSTPVIFPPRLCRPPDGAQRFFVDMSLPIPVPNVEAGAHLAEMHAALLGTALAGLGAFAPDVVVFAAGFDGVRRDEHTRIDLDPTAYQDIVHQVAVACPGAGFVSLLEGGFGSGDYSPLTGSPFNLLVDAVSEHAMGLQQAAARTQAAACRMAPTVSAAAAMSGVEAALEAKLDELARSCSAASSSQPAASAAVANSAHPTPASGRVRDTGMSSSIQHSTAASASTESLWTSSSLPHTASSSSTASATHSHWSVRVDRGGSAAGKGVRSSSSSGARVSDGMASHADIGSFNDPMVAAIGHSVSSVPMLQNPRAAKRRRDDDSDDADEPTHAPRVTPAATSGERLAAVGGGALGSAAGATGATATAPLDTTNAAAAVATLGGSRPQVVVSTPPSAVAVNRGGADGPSAAFLVPYITGPPFGVVTPTGSTVALQLAPPLAPAFAAVSPVMQSLVSTGSSDTGATATAGFPVQAREAPPATSLAVAATASTSSTAAASAATVAAEATSTASAQPVALAVSPWPVAAGQRSAPPPPSQQIAESPSTREVFARVQAAYMRAREAAIAADKAVEQAQARADALQAARIAAGRVLAQLHDEVERQRQELEQTAQELDTIIALDATTAGGKPA